MSDLATVTENTRASFGENSGLGATLKFAFNEGGVIYVDGKSVPNTVTNEDKPAECTIKLSMADYVAMGEGKADGTTLFMMGKLKVEGNMGVAMKLGQVMKR